MADQWDEYFVYARPQYRNRWSQEKLRGVTKDSVTCPECGYIPNAWAKNPVVSLRQHTRLMHPQIWHRTMSKKQFVIKEEPDLAQL